MINPLKEVEVNRFVLRHPLIRPSMDGFTVAQITDPHVGRWVKTHHMDQLVSFVNAQKPDLVALTGDYVGYNKRDLAPCIKTFSNLEAPTFGILGNHDHWAGTELSINAFKSADVPLLNNENLELEGWDGLWVVGVDDAVTNHADVEAAFSSVPKDAFALVLNHVPSIAWECADAGGNLILSGHTHGFQFNIPQITNALAERLGTKLFAGPYRLNNAMLYISRGLGSASWPWRIRAKPELTFFELSPGEQPELEFVEGAVMNVE